MPRDYDDDDRDAPQEMDLEGFGDESYTIDCPGCGSSIHEDAPRCIHCGYWLIDDSPAGLRAQGWFWPAMVALLIAVILVMWHGLGR
jgi:hypothetical protein